MRLQFSIHAGVAIIFYFASERVIETPTGKKSAEDGLFCFVTAAVSFLHESPPSYSPLSAMESLILSRPQKAMAFPVEGVVLQG